MSATVPNKNKLDFNEFFSNLCNFNFNRSTEIIDRHIIDTKDTIENNFLKTNLIWWEVLAGKNQDINKEKLLLIANNSLNHLNNKRDITDLEKFYHTTFIAFKIRIFALDKKYYSAARTITTTSRHISDILKNSDDYSKLLSGIYNSCFGYAYRENLLLRPILAFYPKGNFQKGVLELEQGKDSNNLTIKTESIYFLYKIHSELEKDKRKALMLLRELTIMFPNNIIFNIELLKYEKEENHKESLADHILTKINNNNSLIKRQKIFLTSLL